MDPTLISRTVARGFWGTLPARATEAPASAPADSADQKQGEQVHLQDASDAPWLAENPAPRDTQEMRLRGRLSQKQRRGSKPQGSGKPFHMNMPKLQSYRKQQSWEKQASWSTSQGWHAKERTPVPEAVSIHSSAAKLHWLVWPMSLQAGLCT